MPTTTGMKTGGFYDAHSSTQRAALEAFLPWLEEAIAEHLTPVEGRPIGLLDLGSSEGANAIHAMSRLIQALRRKTGAPIWVFFDDLPTNDFNRLFSNLYPEGAAALPWKDVYAAVVAGSAFGRVLPDASLQLVQVFGRDGDVSTSHGIYDVLSDTLRDLIDDGSLSQGFYRDLAFPVYFRNLDKLVEPITTDAGLASSFHIERAEANEVEVPFNTQFGIDGDRGGVDGRLHRVPCRIAFRVERRHADSDFTVRLTAPKRQCTRPKAVRAKSRGKALSPVCRFCHQELPE